MTDKIKSEVNSVESIDTRRLASSLFAIMLGSFIFFGIGFAPMAEVHNATHDTRHSFAMPCH
jgi:cobalt transporter subunit CbtB